MPRGKPTDKIDEKMLMQYRLSLRTFVDAVRDAGAVPVLMTEGRLVTSRNLPEERKKIRYEYQSLTPGALVHAYELADDIVRKTVEEKNVRFIDASKALTGKAALFNDHVHLSAQGSKVLALLAAENFANWLGEHP